LEAGAAVPTSTIYAVRIVETLRTGREWEYVALAGWEPSLRCGAASVSIGIIRLLHGREFFLQFGGGYRRQYAEVMSRMTVPISYGELQSDRDDSSPGMR